MKEKLKSTTDNYKVFFDHNQDGILVFRIEPNHSVGNFIATNKAATKLFGYNAEELSMLNIFDLELLTEQDKKSRIASYLTLDTYDFETIIYNKRGIKKNVEIQASLINFDSESAFMLTVRDISERKLLEKKAIKAQENLAILLSAIPDLLFEVGINSKIYSFQSYRDELLAYPADKIVGKFFKDILPEKVSKVIFEAINEAKTNGWSMGKQFWLQFPSGQFWFELAVSPIKVKNKPVKRFIVLARDITKRKEAQIKLIESERILIQTQVIANLGSYFFDFAAGKWTSSVVLDSIFGIDSTHLEKNIELWTSVIHPEWVSIVADYINYDVLPNKSNFDKEYKIIKLNTKEERWVHGKGELTFDSSGNPLTMMGSIQDITDRKRTEESLRESEEKIKNIFNVANSGIILADTDGNFLEFNNWWLKMTGYTAEEFSKLRKEDITHPDDLDKTRAWMAKIKNLEIDRYQIEKRYIRKDKSIFWGESFISSIKEKNNSITNTIGIVTDITERKRVQKSLRESEEKYRGLVENSPDGIITYVGDKIRYANARALKIIGASTIEDVIGKSVFKFIYPEGLQNAVRGMKEVITNNDNDNTSRTIEQKLKTLSGKEVYVELNANKTVFETENAFQVIIHDITERKSSQDKIKQLSQAVEQSPIAIEITDTSGKIEYVNSKFLETTGYSHKEILGNSANILKSGHTTQEEYEMLWQTISAGNEWIGEFHNIRKDGTRFWESAHISPIFNAQGTITHYLAIKEDITERKLIQKQLIEAKEKAEESDRLKLAFLANMSHEIRTPMNGILGFTELLKDNRLGTEIQQEYIQIIEKSGKRMLNIINDIISISKVESGQIVVALSETNINEQFDYLNTFFTPEAEQKNIKLIVKKIAPQFNFINTDREKLYAILTNLIKNAIKFTNNGSIEFGCEKKNNFLEFFVKDSGLGISPSQQNLIFERFRQANDTVSRTHEGSGLGLSISKAYVEIQGGTIWLKSKEGIGSSFYFTLPYNADNVSKEKKITNKKRALETEENKIDNLKVLIVEDDKISNLLITVAIKPYCNKILQVGTGFEAIEVCKNNPDIDLIMMDINMPEMGGYEATHQIRKFNKDVIIIAQTANGMQSDRDEAIASGCTDYISKPIKISSLKSLITKYFGNKIIG